MLQVNLVYFYPTLGEKNRRINILINSYIAISSETWYMHTSNRRRMEGKHSVTWEAAPFELVLPSAHRCRTHLSLSCADVVYTTLVLTNVPVPTYARVQGNKVSRLYGPVGFTHQLKFQLFVLTSRVILYLYLLPKNLRAEEWFHSPLFYPKNHSMRQRGRERQRQRVDRKRE